MAESFKKITFAQYFMYQSLTKPSVPLTILAILLITISSCSSIKDVKYFKDIPDSVHRVELAKLHYTDPVVQTDDILSVNIQTADPAATVALTQGNVQNSAVGSSSVGATGNQTIAGYLVDKNGMIELPVIGKIEVRGLTIEQARELIRSNAAKFYRDPTVNIRFANFRVNILGEVNKPGTYVLSNEKVTILDALGLAGDMTIYGKRDNVVLIRQDDNGNRMLVHLDLTSSKVLSSPYYYLRQNDYIYVEPSKTKLVASDAIQTRNIAIGTSVLSIVILLFTAIYNHK